MAFEIHIFKGDPSRGSDHDGFMYTLRMEDGSYHKSNRAWSTVEIAMLSAGAVASKIINKVLCQI